MSGVEFAVPIASVGSQPRIVVWQDEDFIRIRVEPATDVLDLPPLTAQASVHPGTATGTKRTASDEWSSDGVVLPGGTDLRFNYGGDEYEGTIVEGMFAFGDTRHGSPSGAMMAAIRERTDRTVNVNGWNYIEVLKPLAKKWIPLGQLRTSVKTRG